MLARQCVVSLFVLSIWGSAVLSQDAEVATVTDDKFGYSFQHRLLKESAVQMDTTLLDAFIKTEPGSYLEVEWLKPREHAEYIKSMKLGMSLLDMEVSEEKEVSLGTFKATRLTYKSTDEADGMQGLHLILKAESGEWFYCVTCFATGDTAAAEFKVLTKAADSFSLDMSKVPAKPKKGHHVDRVFGYHIKLDGFKSEPKPWKESLLRLWAYYEGETHLGSYMVRLVRKEADVDAQMKTIRETWEKAGRKITGEESVEVGGVKGLRFVVEFNQLGVKHVHEQYVLWANDVIWNVVAAYRPSQSGGKESELLDALKSFKPPVAKKTK
jgi:hypothetical protein